MLNDITQQQPSPLVSILHEQIQRTGPLSFARFMESALYHPLYGYYNSPEFAIGAHGDFITAPEISPVFSQCLADAFIPIANTITNANLLELGPGLGTLAYDLLIELASKNQTPKTYYLIERNERLKIKQQERLAKLPKDIPVNCVWRETPPPSFSGMIIANEVLDALPVERFQVHNNQGHELCVTWKNNQFEWITTDTIIVDDLKRPDGYTSEWHSALPHFLQAVCQSLSQGVMLFIDYGYSAADYYHPSRTQGTLKCFYQHRHHDDPLIYPGHQDITAHVNFTQVAEYATGHGCQLLGYTTQASYLSELGILTKAQALDASLNMAERFQLQQALKTLLLPHEMGDRIKIMGLAKHYHQALPGFTKQDRRHEL